MSNMPAWQSDGSLGVSAWVRHGQWGAFVPGSLSGATPHQVCQGSTHHAEFTDPMLARARLAGDPLANAGPLHLQRSAVPARRAQGSWVASTASMPRTALVAADDGSARIDRPLSGTAPEASAESPAISTAVPAKIDVDRPMQPGLTQPTPLAPSASTATLAESALPAPLAVVSPKTPSPTGENAARAMPQFGDAPTPPLLPPASTGGVLRAMDGRVDQPLTPPSIARPPPRQDTAAASHETVLPMWKPTPTPTRTATPIPISALAVTRSAPPARNASFGGPGLRTHAIANAVVDRSAAAVPIGADGQPLLPTMLARAAVTAIGRGDEPSPQAAYGGVMRGQADGIGNPPHMRVAVQRKTLGASVAAAATTTSGTSTAPTAATAPTKITTTSATGPMPMATATVSPAPPQEALVTSAAGQRPALGIPVAQDHADAADAGTTPIAEPAPATSTSTPWQVAAAQSLAMPLLRDHAVGLGSALTASTTARHPVSVAPTSRTALSAANAQRSVGKPSAPLGATAESAAAATPATTSLRAPSPPPGRTVLSSDRVRQPARPSPVEPLPLVRRDINAATAQREQAIGSAVQIVAVQPAPAPAPDLPVPTTADPRGALALNERVADAEEPASVEPTLAALRDSPMSRASAEPSLRAHGDLALRSPVLGQTRQASVVQRQIEPLSSASGARAARQVDTGVPTLGARAQSRANGNKPPAEASPVLAVTASAQHRLAPEVMPASAATTAVPALAATTAMPISPRQTRERHDLARQAEVLLPVIAARVDSSVDSSPGVPGTMPMAGHIATSSLNPVQLTQLTPSTLPLRTTALGPHPTPTPPVAPARSGLPDRGGTGVIQRTAAGDEPEPLHTAPLRARPATPTGAHAGVAFTQTASSAPLSRQALAPSRERPLPSAEPLLVNDAAAAAPTFRAGPFGQPWQPSPATQAVASNSPPMTMPTLKRRAMNSVVDRLAVPAASLGERVAEPTLEAASAMVRPATISAPAAAAPAAALDLEALVERTCTRLFETLAIEQERRGVSLWL